MSEWQSSSSPKRGGLCTTLGHVLRHEQQNSLQVKKYTPGEKAENHAVPFTHRSSIVGPPDKQVLRYSFVSSGFLTHWRRPKLGSVLFMQPHPSQGTGTPRFALRSALHPFSCTPVSL